MANLEKMVEYIRQYMGRYPMASLRAELLKHNIPEAEIDQAMRIAQAGPPAPRPANPPPGPAMAQPAPHQPGAPLPGQTPTQPFIPIRPGSVPEAGRANTQPFLQPKTPLPQPPPQASPPRTQTPPRPQAQTPPRPSPLPSPPAPTAPPSPEPAQDNEPPGDKPKVQMGRKFILVVDDDPLVRDMMVAKLEEAGYRVTSAEDAAQSIIQAEGVRLALIISDIEMPGFGTGVDALKQLRASPFVEKTLPVIFITGMPPAEARKIVPITDPCVRLLHKPVDWKLLRQYIKDLTGFDAPLD